MPGAKNQRKAVADEAKTSSKPAMKTAASSSSTNSAKMKGAPAMKSAPSTSMKSANAPPAMKTAPMKKAPAMKKSTTSNKRNRRSMTDLVAENKRSKQSDGVDEEGDSSVSICISAADTFAIASRETTSTANRIASMKMPNRGAQWVDHDGPVLRERLRGEVASIHPAAAMDDATSIAASEFFLAGQQRRQQQQAAPVFSFPNASGREDGLRIHCSKEDCFNECGSGCVATPCGHWLCSAECFEETADHNCPACGLPSKSNLHHRLQLLRQGDQMTDDHFQQFQQRISKDLLSSTEIQQRFSTQEMRAQAYEANQKLLRNWNAHLADMEAAARASASHPATDVPGRASSSSAVLRAPSPNGADRRGRSQTGAGAIGEPSGPAAESQIQRRTPQPYSSVSANSTSRRRPAPYAMQGPGPVELLPPVNPHSTSRRRPAPYSMQGQQHLARQDQQHYREPQLQRNNGAGELSLLGKKRAIANDGSASSSFSAANEVLKSLLEKEETGVKVEQPTSEMGEARRAFRSFLLDDFLSEGARTGTWNGTGNF